MQPLKVKFSCKSKDGSRTKVNERNVGSEGTNLQVNRQRMNSSHIAKSYTTRSMLKQESQSYVGTPGDRKRTGFQILRRRSMEKEGLYIGFPLTHAR